MTSIGARVESQTVVMLGRWQNMQGMSLARSESLKVSLGILYLGPNSVCIFLPDWGQ